MSNHLGFVPHKNRAQSPSWGFSHFCKRRALGTRLFGVIIVPMRDYFGRRFFSLEKQNEGVISSELHTRKCGNLRFDCISNGEEHCQDSRRYFTVFRVIFCPSINVKMNFCGENIPGNNFWQYYCG